MSRALFTAVAGMRVHNQKMDVISNNIANVNTAGFKASRVTFRDVFYQNLGSGGGSNANVGGLGGQNPYQVGYGSMISSIDTNHGTTGYTTTNFGSDCYINGVGFFMVSTMASPDERSMGELYYTRVGMFDFDNEGYLVDATGQLVCGVIKEAGRTEPYVHEDLRPIQIDLASDDEALPLNSISINSDGSISGVGQDGVIYGVDENGALIALSGEDAEEDAPIMCIAIANVPNPSGLNMVGNSYYTLSGNTGTPDYYQAGTGNMGSIKTGGLEMSGTDISQEFAEMIMTQRGFQANARIINVVDSMLEEVVNLKR